MNDHVTRPSAAPPAAVVLLALGLTVGIAVACGDADGSQRVSTDVTSGGDDGRAGCVVAIDGVSRYRVAPGETLSGIARNVYGDESLWREIARANPETVGADGAVRAGALLAIPFDGQ